MSDDDGGDGHYLRTFAGYEIEWDDKETIDSVCFCGRLIVYVHKNLCVNPHVHMCCFKLVALIILFVCVEI